MRTILAYLCFRRGALDAIINDPRSLGVGALLVLSAALARNYDTESLLHEPWHLLLSFVASAVAAVSLGLASWLTFRIKDGSVSLKQCLRAFIVLTWMTAPMAWLYAIPYERFLTAPDALRGNLITLTIVATWRVLLLTWVTARLFQVSLKRAIFPVMFVADLILLGALQLMPQPIIVIMGGFQMTESERLLMTVTSNTLLLAAGSLGFWFSGVFFASALCVRDTVSRCWRGVESDRQSVLSGNSQRTAWSLVIAGLLLLPLGQPQQFRRVQVERRLQQGRLEEAVELMVTRPRDEFPPVWSPPPKADRSLDSKILDVLEELIKHPEPTWAHRTYLQKLERTEHVTIPGNVRAREIIRALSPELREELDLPSDFWR